MKRSSYTKYAFNTFGTFVAPYEDYFEDLKPDLKKADIPLSLREYLSTAVMTTGLVFLVELPLFTVITGFLLRDAGGFLVGALLGVILAVLFAGGILGLFYIYPKTRISARKQLIDQNLPFAVLYMSTLAGGGNPVAFMFSLLADFEEFGEVSNEAKKIARDIEFGADIQTALQRAARRTPSENFRELLWGMNNTLSSGASLQDFLRERSRSLMQDYERSLDKFTENLSIYIEMYIVLVIVGSVFLTVLTTIMSAIGFLDPIIIVGIQLLAAFLLLPLAASMFIILVKGISPVG